ncbi:hypothetical protein OSB04_013624 [Centaurea solstitialis]|uniref:Fe2OG dioxygenase domain-containing protein n=1 Tax=Centaurea solstitialis TaxID=347529 RepID=A0AA38WNJ9_9ASTR|nr:hypothetical protein OSB04_013624 [Centaurea solstitialis]
MSALSEAYGDYPIPIDIIPLDFNSVDKIPETHIWSQSDRQTHKNHHKDSIIPVIDLTDPNAIDQIRQACETLGMFQVVNHGVPSELVKKVESETRRLFGLPIKEKCKVLRSPTGATGYGTARISPFYEKAMWHEGFTIMGSCDGDAKTLWPHDYQGFCDTMDDFQNQMKLLAHNLLRLIFQSLDATQEEINWATSSNGGALQLNSYPSCPNPDGTLGLAAHTDTLLLTLLHQGGGVNGLEIFIEGSGWTPVKPVENGFVVNLGDLMHIFSNAKFPVVYHRVMVNHLKQRISFAYFCGPPVESVVAPSSKFRNPCFKSLVVKDYISLKAKNFDKALSLIGI